MAGIRGDYLSSEGETVKPLLMRLGINAEWYGKDRSYGKNVNYVLDVAGDVL